MTELKPCPFCGGNNISDDTHSICCPVEWFGKFRCSDCDTEGPLSEYKYDNEEDAKADGAASWNTRATPWQPIETAPRDGTPILCILEGTHPTSGDKYTPAVVEWHFGKWRDPDNEFEIGADVFTHWMPLPSPPKDTGQ